MRKNFLLIAALTGVMFSGCSTLQLPVYSQEYQVTQPLPGITADINLLANQWGLTVRNDSDDAVKFLIEESSYVTTGGRAERLIRGQTKKLFSGFPQSSVTIPPKARYEGVIVSENFAELNDYQIQAPSLPENPDMPARFYLVFEVAGQKKALVCEVVFKDSGKKQHLASFLVSHSL